MSEERWRKVASKIRYCHGTSSVFQNSIEKYGLVPRKTDGIRPSVYEGPLESERVESVYLGKFDSRPYFCKIAANNASKKFGGEPITFEVKLDSEDFKNFERDEDSYLEPEEWKRAYARACKLSFDEPESFKGKVACYDEDVARAIDESIKEGLISKDEACNPPPWFAEIACYGKFAKRGPIEREKLKKWIEK